VYVSGREYNRDTPVLLHSVLHDQNLGLGLIVFGLRTGVVEIALIVLGKFQYWTCPETNGLHRFRIIEASQTISVLEPTFSVTAASSTGGRNTC